VSTDVDAAKDAAREALRYHPSKVDWATAQLLARPPPYLARALLYLTVLTVVSGTIYASLAEVAVTVDAPGSLRPEAGVVPVAAPTAMVVKELLVRNNEAVEKGQLLVVSQDQLDEAEAARLEADVEALSAVLERDRALDCAPCVADYERLAAGAFASSATGPIREPIAAVRQRLRELVVVRASYARRGASTAGLRRQITLAEGKLAEIERRGAGALLATKVDALNAEIAGARAELAGRESQDQGQVAGARDRLALQLAELPDTLGRYRAQQMVAAPIAGTVTDLAVAAPGRLLAGGQRLLDLVPADTRLVAELLVANKDVSKVRAGQPVRLELAALPKREFGVATGTIESVAANVSYDPRRPGGAELPVYKVTVRLEQQALDKNGVAHPFRLGMGLEAKIVAGRKTMLRLAIERLLSLEDQLR
jgi:multidrug efflux pump subunit AcrA (membrane-fusion protein)